MRLLRIVPRGIRRLILKYQHQIKYDVKFGHKAYAKNTFFEGKNIIREGAALINSRIGFGSYISEKTVLKHVDIGRYTCIGPNVSNFYGKHPANTFVSIHPAFYSLVGQAGFSFVKEQLFEEHGYIDNDKKIANIIGNDVWIGCNVMLMDGITIGDGAIIAAGTIVTKDVEPFSIVGGVPAKFIKNRFSENQINFLLQIKWWDNDYKWLSDNANLFRNVGLLMENKK